MMFATLSPITASNAAQVSCTASPGYTDCIRVTYSGADQTFTVPAGYIAGKPLIVETWAAGGGGSTYYGAYTPNAGGAAGGYSKTVLTGVNVGDTFTVVVGQGGIFNGSSANAYGGGGKYGTTTATAKGSGGGGYSGIFLDAAKTQPVVILVAVAVLRPVRMLRVCQVVVAESEPHQQLQAVNRVAPELYLRAAQQRLTQVARHQRQVRHT